MKKREKKSARKTHGHTQSIDNNSFFLIVGGAFVIIVLVSMMV